MKIYLHIGLHRTGSTFLQEIYFPLLQQKNPNIIYNEKKILRLLRDQYITKIINKSEIDFKKIDFKKIKCELDCAINEISISNKSNLNEINLIFSDENLIPDELFAKNEKKLFEYLEYLNIFFKNPKIIIFIREHLSLIKSLYNQHVKEGNYISMNDFLYQTKLPNIDIKKINYHDLVDYLNINFSKSFYLFKHENFKENLNNLNKIFKTEVDIESINSKKINKSLTDKQIKYLIFLEKKFKISKIEKFLKFFSRFINKKVDSLALKDKPNEYFYINFFLLKIYNYILKIISNFKFSKLIFLIKEKKSNKQIKTFPNINHNFENYEVLNKYLFNGDE